MNINEIATYLEITSGLIRELYWQAFQKGQLQPRVSVARRILNDALYTKGMVGIEAAKFWMKNQAGWTAGDRVDVRGIIGVVHVDPNRATADLLLEQGEKLGRLLEFTAAAGVVIPALENSLGAAAGAADARVPIES
ncbi:MAG: hypothetical protein ACRD34_00175 [Bryobacteraceae bacterium]